MPYDPSNATLNFPALQTTPLRGIPVAAQTPITDAYNIWLAQKARQEQRAKDQRTELREDRRVGAVEEQARAQTAQVKVAQDKAERDRVTEEENQKASAWMQQQYMAQSAGLDPRAQLDLFVRLGGEAQVMFPRSNAADEAQKFAGKKMEMMKSMAPTQDFVRMGGGVQPVTKDTITGAVSMGAFVPDQPQPINMGQGSLYIPPVAQAPSFGQSPALAPMTGVNPSVGQIPIAPGANFSPDEVAMLNDPAARAQIEAMAQGGSTFPTPLWADRPAVQNPAVMPQQGQFMRVPGYVDPADKMAAREDARIREGEMKRSAEMEKIDRQQQQQIRMAVRKEYVDRINNIESRQIALLAEIRKPAAAKGVQLPSVSKAERDEREKAAAAAQGLFDQLEIQKNADMAAKSVLDRMAGMPVADAIQAAEDAKAAYLENIRRGQQNEYYRSLSPGEGPMQGPPAALAGIEGPTSKALRAQAPALPPTSASDAAAAANIATFPRQPQMRRDWKTKLGLGAEL